MKMRLSSLRLRYKTPGINQFFISAITLGLLLITALYVWSAYTYRTVIDERTQTSEWHLSRITLADHIHHDLLRYTEEWQLILLRGEVSAHYYKHLKNFYQIERDIRKKIQQLKFDSAGHTEILKSIALFQSEFKQLGQYYRKALRTYNQTLKTPHIAADSIVKSLSINPYLRMTEVINQSELLQKNTDKALSDKIFKTELSVTIISITLFISSILLMFQLTRRLVILPLNQARELSTKIAEGKLNNKIEIAPSTLETMQILQALEKMQANISKTQISLIETKDEAERANLSKTDFLSRMSHELRTPLNAVLGFSQLLQMNEDNLDAEQQEFVREISNAGEHLLQIIDEILNLSRIERDQMEINIEEVEVGAVTEECLHLISFQLNEKNITLHNNILKQQALLIRADRLRLKQILLNLLSNAIKYNRTNGEIFIDYTTQKQNTVRITIRDTGYGISADKMDLVFKPFERLHKDPMIEGTGIGLALTQKFVELMHGKIGFDSRLENGSTFWFELPITEETSQIINLGSNNHL